ncbi:hypothetical protein [Methylocystis sp.]|uniref:hypothetical protein n=1 Tax=Methylocystis sp. TaxID=1911079 RepID=UPI003DA46425
MHHETNEVSLRMALAPLDLFARVKPPRPAAFRGLCRLMTSPAHISGLINLDNPEEFTIMQLVSTIIDLTGSASAIVHEPAPQDDLRQRRPDICKDAKLLEWKPKTPLLEALLTIIAYFEKLLAEQGQASVDDRRGMTPNAVVRHRA